MVRSTICLGFFLSACSPPIPLGADEPSKAIQGVDGVPHPAADRPGDPAAWL
jgi:hypothetical protein